MPVPPELPPDRLPHPLRQYRDQHNLRLADLAARAGIGVPGLSRIEGGSTEMPSCAIILALASATAHEVGEIDIFRWHFHAATGQQAVAGTIGYQAPRAPPGIANPVKEAASL